MAGVLVSVRLPQANVKNAINHSLVVSE